MKKWGAKQSALPTLNYLVALETTARLGSFRAAADEMNVTQGAVAQQVRALESELGCPLFQRLPRGLMPTASGAEFAARARLALDIVDAATRDIIDERKQQDPDQIVLSATPSFASRWLIPRLHRFSSSHPSLAIMIDASDQLRPLMGAGRVDASIRWGRPPFAGATARFLLPGRAIPVCSPSLTGHGNWAEPADLADVPLISDMHQNWKRWFEIYGKAGTRIVGPRFSQTNLAIEAAEQGLGVALVPSLLAAGSLQEGRLVKVLGDSYELDTESGFYILTAEHVAPPPLVTTVVDWLLSEVNT